MVLRSHIKYGNQSINVLDGCYTKLSPHRMKVNKRRRQSLQVILGTDGWLGLSRKVPENSGYFHKHQLFVWGENMNYIAIDASVELTVISVFLEMGVRHDKR